MIPKELEELIYEEKEDFARFLNNSYEKFKSFSPKKETQSEPSRDTGYPTFTKSTEETNQKTKIVKEDIIKEKNENEVREKLNTTSDDKKESVSKENENENEKGLITPRSSSLMWFLGVGVSIGLLFYIFSRKKY